MKPLASISLDLDNQWSYMKTHGDKGWESFPSYFDKFIPDFLQILESYKLKITFFVIGQDAALEKNRIFLKLIASSGHEIANHSFNHDPFIQLYNKAELNEEIVKAENAIVEATGIKPIGFRGPGFSWGKDLFEVLLNNGYMYDASTFPTFLGPLARKFYFASAKLTSEEKEKLKNLYGGFSEGFRSINPYFWKVNGRNIREIPVSTFPLLKFPVHLSYLLYLAKYSEKLMLFYLKSAIKLAKLTKTEMSFLLHPTDILGGDVVPALNFFPGMELTTSRKKEIFSNIMRILNSNLTLVTMKEHAEKSNYNKIKPIPQNKN